MNAMPPTQTTAEDGAAKFAPLPRNWVKRWEPLLAFLLFVLIVLLTGVALFQRYKQQLTHDEQASLGIVSKLKTAQITNWMAERKSDAQAFQDDPLFVSGVERWRQLGFPNGEIRATLAERMALMQNSQAPFGCTEIALFDEKARLRLSTSNVPVKETERKLLLESMRSGQLLFSDIHTEKHDGNGRLDMNFAAPLRSFANGKERTIGAILFYFDPRSFLFPLIRYWPSPSPSAESLLVRREGNEVVFLNDLRHVSNPPLSLRLPLSKEHLPAAMAALGREGTTEGLDYRKVPVVGVINKVPGTPWKMISKIDQAEIYASINRLAKWLAVLLLALIGVGGGIAAVWQRNQLRSFQALEKQREQELERKVLSRHLTYLSKYANDIILLVDGSGKIVDFNDRALEAYGYAAEEFPNMSIFELRRIEFISQAFENFRKIHAAGSLRFEAVHTRKNGEDFPVEASVRVFDIDGRKFQQAIIRDITERKNTEAALTRQSDFIRQVIDSDSSLIFVKDAEGKFLLANKAMAESYGQTTESIVGKYNWELTDDTEQVAEFDRDHHEVIHSRQTRESLYTATLSDGREHTLHTIRKPLVQGDGSISTLTVAMDITDLTAAENKLRRLNRALKLLGECNAAVVHIDDEEQLLAEICRLAVETGGYRMAWVGLGEHNADKSVLPVAKYGHDEGYLDLVDISWADSERGRGPTGTAIRTGETQVNSNFRTNAKIAPWRGAALARGYLSSIALPLRSNGKCIGAFTIYAEETNAFNPDEIKLLEELADNMAFGITALRAIAWRSAAVEKLQQSEELFRFLTENTADMVFLMSMPGRHFDYVSPASTRLLGYTPGELYDSPSLILGLIHPDSKAYVEQQWERIQSGVVDPYIEFSIAHRSGEQRWLSQRNTPIWSMDGKGTLVALQGVISDVTERKKAKTQLENQRVRLRTLVQTIPDLIWLKDPEGVYLSCNPQFERFFGAKEADIVGKTDYDFVDEKLADFFRQKDREAMAAGKPKLNEEWVTYPDSGQRALLETIKVPMRDESGHLIGVMGIARDITARRQAEESEIRLRHILDNTLDMIFIFHPGTLRFAYMNRGAVDSIGYSTTEWQQMTPPDIYPLMSEQEFRKFVAPLIADHNRLLRFETLHKTKNGSFVPVEVQLQFIQEHEEDGLFVAIVRDITERKRAEEGLQKQKDFMRQVIDTDPNRIMVKDASGNILLANHSAAAAYGMQPRDMVGRNLADIILPRKTLEQFLDADRKVIEEGSDVSQIATVTLPNGKSGWLLTLKKQLTMPNGGLSVLSISVDITQQKLSEIQLAESYKELQQLSLYLENARADERARIALHLHDEMGSTLAAMKMRLAWLASKMPAELPHLAEEVSQITELVAGGIHTMHRIVTQLSPNLLGDIGLIAAIADYVKKFSQHANIDCMLDLPEDDSVLNAEQSLTVFRILQESLNNVAKHSQASRVDIALSLRARSLTMTVRDNGIGFDPYQRKERSFGLLGIRERALMVGGKARIYSKPGRGTRVTVSIPIQSGFMYDSDTNAETFIPN
ncbi:MAG: PAS domain S-box protein [Nitrosomonadales bacterium]|nr:PAS domain S-box protein [Nitrosomonadales bacterium]